jgi:hypothetical protein
MSRQRQGIEILKRSPPDVRNRLAMDLPPQKIFELCETQPELASLCSSSAFWKMRIQRDFNLAPIELNNFIDIWKPKDENETDFMMNFFYFRGNGPVDYEYGGLALLSNLSALLSNFHSLEGQYPNIPILNNILGKLDVIGKEYDEKILDQYVDFKNELAYKAQILHIRTRSLIRTADRSDLGYFKIPIPEDVNVNTVSDLFDSVSINLDREAMGVYEFVYDTISHKRFTLGELVVAEQKEIDEWVRTANLRLKTLEDNLKEGDIIYGENLEGEVTVFWYVWNNNGVLSVELLAELGGTSKDGTYLPLVSQNIFRDLDIRTIEDLQLIYPKILNSYIMGITYDPDDINSYIILGSEDEPHSTAQLPNGHMIVVPKRGYAKTPESTRRSVVREIPTSESESGSESGSEQEYAFSTSREPIARRLFE